MTAPAVTDTWMPLCMEPDELVSWSEMRDRSTAYHDRTAHPCRDCLPGFAAEMRAVGRCNGTPSGIEEDTEVEQPATPTPPRSLPVRRTTVLDVAAPPCESCAHEPVCGLRAALEGIADVETTAPRLPDGLSLTLTAVVSCGHYLRDKGRAFEKPKRTLSPEGLAAVRANGIRARLLSKGAGKWAESAGENAKFGLSTAEILAAAETLKEENLTHCLKVLHFHIGSQVPDILTVKKAVQEAARSHGRLFPLSLAAEGSATIGGNLATNAGGVQVLRYGMIRELVLGLEVVLPNGEIARLQPQPLRDRELPAESRVHSEGSRCAQGVPAQRAERPRRVLRESAAEAEREQVPPVTEHVAVDRRVEHRTRLVQPAAGSSATNDASRQACR